VTIDKVFHAVGSACSYSCSSLTLVIVSLSQTELEECTETLSEMVARPYLRTPRTKIVQTAHLVQRKRHELVTAIAKGLVPPDTSPDSRGQRKKINVQIDVSVYRLKNVINILFFINKLCYMRKYIIGLAVGFK